MEKVELFDWLNSINDNKKDLMDETNEKDFNSFLVLRGLSLFPETILYANEMNMLPSMDNRMKYDYLMQSIRKSKRFSKWPKQDKVEDLDLIVKHYNCNKDRGLEILDLLSKKDLENLKKSKETGGKK
jgi:hypothetical protein